MKPSTAISRKQIHITTYPARPELHRMAERAEGLSYTAEPQIEYHIPRKIQAFRLMLPEIRKFTFDSMLSGAILYFQLAYKRLKEYLQKGESAW
jgi:hypothetical protein